MIIRTTRQYDIAHTGNEMDRLEILGAFQVLKEMVEKASLASVIIESVKPDMICVTIEVVDMP